MRNRVHPWHNNYLKLILLENYLTLNGLLLKKIYFIIFWRHLRICNNVLCHIFKEKLWGTEIAIVIFRHLVHYTNKIITVHLFLIKYKKHKFYFSMYIYFFRKFRVRKCIGKMRYFWIKLMLILIQFWISRI